MLTMIMITIAIGLYYVVEELKNGKGTQFDPRLVDILLELINSGRIDVSGINQLSVEAED